MNKRMQFIGVVTSVAVAAVCGFIMANRPLFGWWTLPFLAAVWAFFVFVFQKRYNLRWLLLSTLSGLMLSAGFVPSPLAFLMFGAFVPLLIVEKEISAQKDRRDNYLSRLFSDGYGAGTPAYWYGKR